MSPKDSSEPTSDPKEKPVGVTEPEKGELRDDEWMFRPCDVYKDEYDDCTSIRARFHQYFVFGKTVDCSQWKTDYHNCYMYYKYNANSAYEDLVKSEKARRIARLRGHYQNNVWQRRTAPPENWNAPLPEWMQEEYKTTLLHHKSEQMKAGIEDSFAERNCTII